MDPSSEASAAIVYVLGSGFDENGWLALGTAPFVDAFKKKVVRWRSIVGRPGFMVCEEDPFRPGGEPEVYKDTRPGVEDPDSPEHFSNAIPSDVVSYLQRRWGLSQLPIPSASDAVRNLAFDIEQLLDHAVVAELLEDAESDPKRALELLAQFAQGTLADDGFLDAEIGTPALVAAAATKDTKLARSFRTTPKTMAKLVPAAKAVASRVLDPKTSELAQLHEESDTLARLVAYVNGLGLD